MQFTATIHMNSAAFEDEPCEELASILRGLAEALIRCDRATIGRLQFATGKVRDTDGRRAGEWQVRS